MNRISSRRLAAGAATGAILLSLAYGGAAVADDLADPIAADAPDTTPPVLNLDLPNAPSSGWHTTPVMITLSGGDAEGPLAGITYRLDGGEPVTNTSPTVEFTVETDGRHTLTAWATDAAGNVSEPQTRSFAIDTELPDIGNYPLGSNLLYRLGEHVPFTYDCWDWGSGIESCSDTSGTPGVLDTTAEGDFEFELIAEDIAGNRRVMHFSYTVIDDSAAPVVRAEPVGTRGNDDWLTDADAAVRIWMTDENPGLVSYSFDHHTWTSATGEIAVPLRTDGTHVIEYRGTDRLGNSSDIETITVRRDATAPLIAFAATDAAGAVVENGAVVEPGAEITFGHECTDATSGIADCTSEVPAGSLLDTQELGSHSVLMTATDAAGLESTAIFEYTVEAPGEPTDPGTGGEQPGPGTGGEQPGPAQPAPAQPAPAQHTPSRPAATTSDDRLASTGVGQITPLGVLTASMLAAGSALIAIGLRRRNAR